MTPSLLDHSGSHVIVAGGGSGIGRATAELLHERGSRVTVIDLRVDAVPEGMDAVALDARDEVAVARAVAQAADRAPLTGLVNSIGVEFVSDVVETTLTDWDRVIGTNLTSFHVLTRAVAPYLASGSSIVNVASQLAEVGTRRFAAYTASKAALLGYTRSVALDLADRGIRVNAICPGAVDTPLLRRQFENGAGPQGSLDDLVGMHPIGRLGLPRELAEPIAFLLSRGASFMTGATMVVDGGYTAQ